MPNPKKDNFLFTTNLLLNSINVRVNQKTQQVALNNHPDYGSLFAISDSLKSWGVKNEAYRIEIDDIGREEILFPFIAHHTVQGGRWSLVHYLDSEGVVYSDEKDQKTNIPLSDFLNNWDRIALHAWSDKQSGEPNYWTNKVKYLLDDLLYPSGIIVFIFILGLILSDYSLLPEYYALLTTKFLGMIVSIVILAQSIGRGSSLFNKICSAVKTDCNGLLQSDAAKITEWLSWSEVGFFYFVGSFFSLLLFPEVVHTLKFMSVLALPYSFYSIFYQYRNDKWCILCCLIQGVLWIEFTELILFGVFETITIPRPHDLLLVALCLCSVVIMWALIKPLIVSMMEIGVLKFELHGFKYNGNLFNQALYSQPRYAIGEELQAIELGNPDADTVITLVSDPFCGPCARAHQVLEDWAAEDNNIRLKVLFSLSSSNHQAKGDVARQIISLNQYKDKYSAKNALADWFLVGVKDTSAWMAKYQTAITEESFTVCELQKQWCALTDITHTPTIFVNGYKVPMPYSIEEVKYFLD